MTETAYAEMTAYIANRSDAAEHLPPEVAQAVRNAREDAAENGVPAPSPAVGDLLTVLAAASGANGAQGAVAVTPAAGVVGLHLLAGLPEKAMLTCIEPEAALQAGAKDFFRSAGYASSRVRFLTARPLDVLGRLANGAYQLVYADVAPTELTTFIEQAWPLLAPGGTLVIAGSLLDGTVADHTRRDRATEAAREAEAFVDKQSLEQGAAVARLPLDGGLTLLTKTV